MAFGSSGVDRIFILIHQWSMPLFPMKYLPDKIILDNRADHYGATADAEVLVPYRLAPSGV